MQCPIDQSDLQVLDRQGVEIDFCRQCRGVWLDRGELDKLIERSVDGNTGNNMRGARPGAQHVDTGRSQYRDEPPRYDDRRYRDDDDDDDARRGRKRRGWLSDIFDFD